MRVYAYVSPSKDCDTVFGAIMRCARMMSTSISVRMSGISVRSPRVVLGIMER